MSDGSTTWEGGGGEHLGLLAPEPTRLTRCLDGCLLNAGDSAFQFVGVLGADGNESSGAQDAVARGHQPVSIPWNYSFRQAQSCDDEFDHATRVVAGVVVRADTEIADATQQFVGIHVGENLARRGSSVEQLGAHGDEAVEEIGVQSLEGGIVGLQRLGEAVLGDQEVDEKVDPTRQGGVRCAAVRQQYRTGLSACLDLVSVDGDDEIGSRREEITTSRSTFMPQRFDTAIPSNRARLDAVEQLAKVADEADLTMIQLALGFVTAHPAVTSAIIGPRTMDHLHSQLAAADTVLSADVLDAIDAIVAPGVDLAAHEKNDTPPALLDAAQRRR